MSLNFRHICVSHKNSSEWTPFSILSYYLTWPTKLSLLHTRDVLYFVQVSHIFTKVSWQLNFSITKQGTHLQAMDMHSEWHVRAQPPPSPLSELHACSSVPARGEGSGVSHNSGVAWDVEGQNSRGGKTRVARASQVSRKSQLFRDTLLVLPGRLCSQNGISLRCRFLLLQTTTACAAKKLLKYQGWGVRLWGWAVLLAPIWQKPALFSWFGPRG